MKEAAMAESVSGFGMLQGAVHGAPMECLAMCEACEEPFIQLLGHPCICPECSAFHREYEARRLRMQERLSEGVALEPAVRKPFAGHEDPLDPAWFRLAMVAPTPLVWTALILFCGVVLWSVGLAAWHLAVWLVGLVGAR